MAGEIVKVILGVGCCIVAGLILHGTKGSSENPVGRLTASGLWFICAILIFQGK